MIGLFVSDGERCKFVRSLLGKSGTTTCARYVRVDRFQRMTCTDGCEGQAPSIGGNRNYRLGRVLDPSSAAEFI